MFDTKRKRNANTITLPTKSFVFKSSDTLVRIIVIAPIKRIKNSLKISRKF